MGTYTTNYQLYTPTVGETGWGTLVNGNFTTIDTTMKGLSNRITTVENEVNGNLSCTSVTATTGTFSGAVTGASFNGVPIKSVITVTPNNTHAAVSKSLLWNNEFVCVLPRLNGVVYNGSVRVYGYSSTYLWYITSTTGSWGEYTLPINNYLNIPLNNAECLYIKPQVNNGASLCGFTLS